MSEEKESKLKKAFTEHKQFKSEEGDRIGENKFIKPRAATKLTKKSFVDAKAQYKKEKDAFKEAKQDAKKLGKDQEPIQKSKRLKEAEREKKLSKRVYKRTKKSDTSRLSYKTKRLSKAQLKNYGNRKVQEALEEDETLATALDTKRKVEKSKQIYNRSKPAAKLVKKAGKVSFNFVDRGQNLLRGNGFQKTPEQFKVTSRVRKAFQQRITGSKNLSTASKGLSQIVSFFKKKTKVKVFGLGLLLIAFISFFAGGTIGGSMAIYQEDKDLTDSWTYLSYVDAQNSDSGNVFYSKLDDVMFYMNYKFEDYGLNDIMDPRIHIGTYKGYLNDVWKGLNGSKLKYELTTMDSLEKDKKSPFHLDTSDYEEMKDIDDDTGYTDLSNQLEFPIDTDSLVVNHRYGYERNGEDIKLHDSIDAVVKDQQDVKAPLDGKIELSGKKGQLIIVDKNEVKLTVTGLNNGRFVGGEKVKAGDVIGQAKGTDLNFKFEKYDDDDKKWFTVNPGFYFPKVTYTQFTTLASANFDPTGDVSKRAQQIYDYLSKLGYTKEGIAAMIGNFDTESHINAKRAEGDYLAPPVGASDSSWDDTNWLNMGGPDIYNGRLSNIVHRGLGLGQWTDTADGGNRHTLLINYAKSKGKPWYDLGLQIDFMLNGDTAGSQTALKNVLSRKAGATIPALTQYFLIFYEGNPGDKLQQRIQSAENWYNYFNNNGGHTNESGQKVLDQYKDKIQPEPTTKETKDGWPGNAYALGNCTWYVYNREAQLGHSINPYMGNGAEWARNYVKTPGASLTDNPQRGDIAVFSGGAASTSAQYGHVAVVEYANSDGSFVISEMNYGGIYQMNWRVLSKQAGISFIHLG
ncbi:CHAP domain protein [Weissella oryzae SG25]|uniref:CHAP domain protein n=1 Tax=Weissella oryzae (strain DSM 25784 / JCM 18191 / LMG 30913 / SG25) TaxID=1329250 RepID=A0A069CVD8_WEIOS|nr:phage tail tip lysozyme [Weissella oryzae]GAK31332.1 CHAP domain protein [Weissella oryzae SG25]